MGANKRSWQNTPTDKNPTVKAICPPISELTRVSNTYHKGRTIANTITVVKIYAFTFLVSLKFCSLTCLV